MAESISDNKEALLVYSAISVGIHSLQYWNNNLQNWIKPFYDEMPNKFWGSLWRALKQVAKNDIASGAALAATAIVMNTIPGAGQVGYGAVIAGGAAGASTYTAVMLALDAIPWLQ